MTDMFNSNQKMPGVYLYEEDIAGPILGVGTSTAAFVGPASEGKTFDPTRITNWTQFKDKFGIPKEGETNYSSYAIRGFFENGGTVCYFVRIEDEGGNGIDVDEYKKGIDKLKTIDDINIICAPDVVQLTNEDNIAAVHQYMILHCEVMQDRFAVIDPPKDKTDTEIINYRNKNISSGNGYAALYYPFVEVMDLSGKNTIKVPPSCVVAGLYARSDNQYGVYQAPAGEFLPLKGVIRVENKFDNATHGSLNEAGINVIRSISGIGNVIWGARTLAPTNNTQWRYINVRRFMLYVEESVMKAANALVFKPNNKALWQTVKRQIRGFLTTEWQKGSLIGNTPDEAFVIKVDEENNKPETLAQGILYIDVGLYPITPAEFIIFRVAQQPGGPTVEEK